MMELISGLLLTAKVKQFNNDLKMGGEGGACLNIG